jgi:hypothetical protein
METLLEESRCRVLDVYDLWSNAGFVDYVVCGPVERPPRGTIVLGEPLKQAIESLTEILGEEDTLAEWARLRGLDVAEARTDLQGLLADTQKLVAS